MQKIKILIISFVAASMLCACTAKEIKPEETTAIQTETESEAQPEKETDIVDAIKIGASRTDVR